MQPLLSVRPYFFSLHKAGHLFHRRHKASQARYMKSPSWRGQGTLVAHKKSFPLIYLQAWDHFKITAKALTIPTKSHNHTIGTQEKRFGFINLDFLHLYSRNNFIRSGHFYIFHKDPLTSQGGKKSAIQCFAQLKPIYSF